MKLICLLQRNKEGLEAENQDDEEIPFCFFFFFLLFMSVMKE